MNAAEAVRPNHSGRVLSVAFVVAVAINLVLLLLIGALISQQETQLASAPNPQPVDFIRIEPKPEEKKPVPPPEIKPVVEASPGGPQMDKRPAPASIKPSSAASPGRPHRTGAAKTGKAKAKAKATSAAAAGVAAPKIDIPEQGTGPAFASVPGSGSRLTAPPAQWNPEKTPDAPGADRKSTGGTGNGGGGGGSYSRGLVVLSRVLPRYPPRAEARGIEGWVRLEITTTPAGTVSEAKVVDASPKDLFDQAALEAIRRWRFKPAFREGRAAAQRATLTLRFRLEKPP